MMGYAKEWLATSDLLVWQESVTDQAKLFFHRFCFSCEAACSMNVDGGDKNINKQNNGILSVTETISREAQGSRW